MALAQRLPFTCRQCTRRIASTHPSPRPSPSPSSYTLSPSLSFAPRTNTTTTTTTTTTLRAHSTRSGSQRTPSIPPRSRPQYPIPGRRNAWTEPAYPRIAIIGSGPAGFYTAHRLLHNLEYAVVDMYEQLPVPYGLVRFGVAPDHPDVKNCQDTFETVADSPRFNYIGNVRVGHDLALKDMKPHYDAILFSYGADEDKRLGIPGEDTQGVYSARAFVGWYNGLPQFQDLQPDLKSGGDAVVIGQGNVALDVARILLSPVDSLRHTDITEQALQTLADSKIKNVTVVGRRGPLQASFTVKEARELMKIPSLFFTPVDTDFYPVRTHILPRVQKRISDVLINGTGPLPLNPPKKWSLDFLKAPTRFNANPADRKLWSVTFANQTFGSCEDPHDPNATVLPAIDASTKTLPANIAFRSVGYKSTALKGLSDLGVQFDPKLGIIPNDVHGRVVSTMFGPGLMTAGHVPGLYCAGWVKRGPTGVIASTMNDAFETADTISNDWVQGVPFMNHVQGGKEDGTTGIGWDGVKESVIAKGIRPLGWEDWKKIDFAERLRGRKNNKAREKFGSVKEMIEALDL